MSSRNSSSLTYLTGATPGPEYLTETTACSGSGSLRLPAYRPTEFRMAFGKIVGRMGKAIQPLIEDKTVWDLGAGDLRQTEHLLQLGASWVVAVDKSTFPNIQTPRITLLQSVFEAVDPPEEGIDVAFLSWPDTSFQNGLVQLLDAARTVIYLGKNTSGTCCGFHALWEHLMQREILLHMTQLKNALLTFSDQPCT